MTTCQVETKDYLISKTREVAQAKAEKFKAQVALQRYGDRIEVTFSGPTAYNAALGFHSSFDRAFPSVINKPRNVQNNVFVVVPIDINTVNKIIDIADRSKRFKAETTPNQVTDEYGNTWNEVTITPDMANKTILAEKSISEFQDTELEEYIKLNSEEAYADLLNDTTEEVNHEEFLNDIIVNGKTEGIRTLAKNLQNLIKKFEATVGLSDLRVFFADQKTLETLSKLDPIFGKTSGLYDAATNVIYLSKELSREQTQKVYLHELAHAITEKKIQNDPELKKEFTKLYEKAKESLGNDARFNYRLSNVSEFIAGAFNDRDFITALSKLESVNGKTSSLFMEFLNLVKRILGLDKPSLLDDLYYLVETTASSKLNIDTYLNYTPVAEISQEEAYDEVLKNLWNKQVNSINNTIKELQPISGGKTREEVRSRIAILENSLRDLENSTSFTVIFNVAERNLQNAKYLLSKKNHTAFDINEVTRIIEDLENFDLLLENSAVPSKFKEEKAAIRKQVVELSSQLQEVYKTYISKIAKQKGFDYTYEQLTKAVEDMSKTSSLIYSAEYSHIPLMRVIAAVLNDFQAGVRDEMLSFEDRKKAIQTKYKNYSLANILENGHLIAEYVDDYYEEEKAQNQAVTDAYKPIKDLKESGDDVGKALWANYFKIVNDKFEWYKSNHTYTLTDEGKAKWEKDLADKTLFFTTDGVVDYEALAEWVDENSPYKNEVGYLEADGTFTFTAEKAPNKYSRWYKYLDAVPISKWNNPKYAAIKDNEVYKFFRDTYIDAFSKIPHRSFLDLGSFHKLVRSIQFDTSENNFRFRGLWAGLGETASSWFMSKVNLDDVDGVDKSVRDAYGRPKTTIDVPQIEHLADSVSDPYELLSRFYNLAVGYEHKVHAAPMADLLYYQLTQNPALQNTITGQIIKNIGSADPVVVQKGLIRASQNMRYKIDSVLSEKTRLDEDKVSPLTPEEEEDLRQKTLEWLNNGAKGPAPTVKKFSYVRLMDSVSDFTRLNLIGLKPFSAVANLVMGVASNYMYAARNKEFEDVHLDKATKMMFQSMFKFWTGGKVVTTEAKKTALLVQKFGIVNNLYEEQGQLGKSSNASKMFVKLMYLFQESGEYLIHSQLMMAMMFKQKVTNNKGESKSLWEAYTIKKDSVGNEILEWDTANFGEAPEWNSRELLDSSGMNISKLNTFERSLKQVRIDTQGDYQNALLIKATWVGRMGMIFRTWIPSAIRQRFGEEIDGEFKGRYRSWVSYFKNGKRAAKSWWAIPGMTGKTVGVILSKMLNIGPMKYLGAKALSQKAGESYEEHLKKLGLSELDIENMRVNIREMQFILWCAIIAAALKQLADDDDDKTLNFMTNLAQRTYQDLSFFVVPENAMAIVKDPIPTWKTIQDSNDIIHAILNYIDDPDSDVYQKGKRKGKSKLGKEMQDLTPIWSAVNSTFGTMDQIFNTNSYRYAGKK